MRFVVPSICKQIADSELQGTPCRLDLGNVDTRRDFLDVRDVVQAYRLLARDGDPDHVYLAGRGESVAVRDLAELAIRHAYVPVEIRSNPSRVRDGEQSDLYGDPRALKRLGWSPAISLDASILDTLDYWRARAHMEVD